MGYQRGSVRTPRQFFPSSKDASTVSDAGRSRAPDPLRWKESGTTSSVFAFAVFASSSFGPNRSACAATGVGVSSSTYADRNVHSAVTAVLTSYEARGPAWRHGSRPVR